MDVAGEYNRLNAYHVMWLFVFFDLPTNTAKERRAAQRFRKVLVKGGFNMLQYSVYTRHCVSKQSAEARINGIRAQVPEQGQVSILTITDKQYGNTINIWGARDVPLDPTPQQLDLF